MKFGSGFRVHTLKDASVLTGGRLPWWDACGVVTRVKIDSLDRQLYEVEHRRAHESGRADYLREELRLEVEPHPHIVLIAELVLEYNEDKAKVLADSCEELAQYGAAELLRGSASWEVRYMLEMLARTTGIKAVGSVLLSHDWKNEWQIGWVPGYQPATRVGPFGATGATGPMGYAGSMLNPLEGATGATGSISGPMDPTGLAAIPAFPGLVPNLGDVQLTGEEAFVRTDWNGLARAPFNGRLVGISPEASPAGRAYSVHVQNVALGSKAMWLNMPLVEGDEIRVTCSNTADGPLGEPIYRDDPMPAVTLRIRREP